MSKTKTEGRIPVMSRMDKEQFDQLMCLCRFMAEREGGKPSAWRSEVIRRLIGNAYTAMRLEAGDEAS